MGEFDNEVRTGAFSLSVQALFRVLSSSRGGDGLVLGLLALTAGHGF